MSVPIDPTCTCLLVELVLYHRDDYVSSLDNRDKYTILKPTLAYPTKQVFRLILCQSCYWQVFHQPRDKSEHANEARIRTWAERETNYSDTKGALIKKMPSWLKEQAYLGRVMPHYVAEGVTVRKVVGLAYLRASKRFLYCDFEQDGKVCGEPIWSKNGGLPIKHNRCKKHNPNQRAKANSEVERHREKMKDPAYRAEWNRKRRAYRKRSKVRARETIATRELRRRKRSVAE